MKQYVKWLSTPYYFNPSIKFKFKVSFIHGLFVFLFLYLFKPFYLSQIEVILLEYTLGIGIIAFLGTFIILCIPALIFKEYFNEDKWTVGRNIFLMAIGVTIIGIVLWYFGEMYKEPYNLKKLGLIEFLGYTFLVSLIPLTLFVFVNEKKVRERREKKVLEIIDIKRKNEINISRNITSKVCINSDNGKDTITFQIDDLVYITSQGNYASFFLKTDNILVEKILRVTLTKILTELKEYQNIIKCHKSYIVNTNLINNISGNARGYLLKSDLVSFDIPVSRNLSKQLLKGLQSYI